jgi:electron transport complex protein RnfA
MGLVIDFLYFTFVVIFTENIVFTRALGSSKIFLFLGNKKAVLRFSAITAVSAVVSSTASYFIGRELSFLHQNVKNIVFPAIHIAVVTIVYLLLCLILGSLKGNKKAKGYYNILPLSMYNYVLFGTLLLGSKQNIVLFQRIAFSLGSVLGFVIAALVVSVSLEAINKLDIPKSFKGVPIKLLYLGLISLAFYGLSGHELAF